MSELGPTGRTGSTFPPGAGRERLAGALSPTDRDRILQATIECCAESGYQQLTVEEIVGQAAVTRTSFDALFAGKDDCALAAIDKVMSEALTAVGSSDAPSEIDLERGILAAREILELMARLPSDSRFALIEARQGGTPEMRERYESGVRLLALMVERARAYAPHSSASASAPRTALGGAEAVVRRELAAGRPDRLPQLLPDFVYAVLVPLVGQEAALRHSALASRLMAEAE